MRRFVIQGGVPQPLADLTIEAPTVDAARAAARERCELDGYRVRALSFGPTGLVAYVEERVP